MTLNSFVKTDKPRIICIGEALVDRLGPLGGNPAIDKPVQNCLGGAPANVSCGLAKLGTQAAFCGRLGVDEVGEEFRDLMNTRKVNLDGLQNDLDRPTRVVLVRRDLKGERVFQGFAGDVGAGFADQAFALTPLVDVWPLLISQAKWLLTGTIPLASSTSADTLLWCIKSAFDKNIQIAVDINWRPTFWNVSDSPNAGPDKNCLEKIKPLVEYASLLKLAREEATWFFNTSDPFKISRSLPQHPDVVITDGSEPIRWFIGGFQNQMPIYAPQKVVDTTGAGDAFISGLLHQFVLHSKSLLTASMVKEMITFAAACGALVCEGAGAIAPQPNQFQVEEFIASRVARSN